MALAFRLYCFLFLLLWFAPCAPSLPSSPHPLPGVGSPVLDFCDSLQATAHQLVSVSLCFCFFGFSAVPPSNDRRCAIPFPSLSLSRLTLLLRSLPSSRSVSPSCSSAALPSSRAATAQFSILCRPLFGCCLRSSPSLNHYVAPAPPTYTRSRASPPLCVYVYRSRLQRAFLVNSSLPHFHFSLPSRFSVDTPTQVERGRPS